MNLMDLPSDVLSTVMVRCGIPGAGALAECCSELQLMQSSMYTNKNRLSEVLHTTDLRFLVTNAAKLRQHIHEDHWGMISRVAIEKACILPNRMDAVRMVGLAVTLGEEELFLHDMVLVWLLGTEIFKTVKWTLSVVAQTLVKLLQYPHADPLMTMGAVAVALHFVIESDEDSSCSCMASALKHGCLNMQDTAVVQMLLQHKVFMGHVFRARESRLSRVLDSAAQNTDMLRLLLQNSPFMDHLLAAEEAYMFLFEMENMCEKGSLEAVRLMLGHPQLMEKVFTLPACHFGGWFYEVCKLGNPDMLQMFLQHTAFMQKVVVSNSNINILMKMCKSERTDIVRMLVNHNAFMDSALSAGCYNQRMLIECVRNNKHMDLVPELHARLGLKKKVCVRRFVARFLGWLLEWPFLDCP